MLAICTVLLGGLSRRNVTAFKSRQRYCHRYLTDLNHKCQKSSRSRYVYLTSDTGSSTKVQAQAARTLTYFKLPMKGDRDSKHRSPPLRVQFVNLRQ